MDNVFNKLYVYFCCNEGVKHTALPYDKKEWEYYEKFEKILSKDDMATLEKFLDVIMADAEFKSELCFKQGVKLGISLASEKIDILNL